MSPDDSRSGAGAGADRDPDSGAGVDAGSDSGGDRPDDESGTGSTPADRDAAEAAVLFSGGRDSALVAVLLERFYRVELVTCTFGVTDDWRLAEESADALDLPFGRIDLDPAVARAAADRVQADGYPRAAIDEVHDHAVEVVAGREYDAVADGTRRDDRTPTVDRPAAQSLEDRHGVDYLAPLRGIGHGAVAAMADRTLRVERGPSDSVGRADYEAELRAILRERGAPVDRLFPAHEQSRVTGRRSP